MGAMGDFKFYWLLVAQAVAALASLFLLAIWPGPWNLQRVAGAVLLVAGMALVFAARLQLGASFSILPRAKQLVTRGLYSRIRNRIYVFGTMAIAGMLLILQRPRLWLALMALVGVQIVRARREAEVLESKFGDEYRSYRKQTWF
jgi:protein-S-isoprenylcysteine O-methyltransferase Ste14